MSAVCVLVLVAGLAGALASAPGARRPLRHPTAAEQLAVAARATVGHGSAVATVVATVIGPNGVTVDQSGKAQIDFVHDRVGLVEEVSSTLVSEPRREEIRRLGRRLFGALAGFSALPGGRPWVDLSHQLASTAGVLPGQVATMESDPAEVLDLLGSPHTTAAVATGVPPPGGGQTLAVTVLPATFDRRFEHLGLPPSLLAQAVHQVDASGLVQYQVTIDVSGTISAVVVSLPGVGGLTTPDVVALGLSGLGTKVRIRAPRPGDVMGYPQFAAALASAQQAVASSTLPAPAG